MVILVQKITILHNFLSQAALNNYNLKRGKECCCYLNLSTCIQVCPVFWGAIRMELCTSMAVQSWLIYVFKKIFVPKFCSEIAIWAFYVAYDLLSVIFRGWLVLGRKSVLSLTALCNHCHPFHLPNVYLKM